MASATPGPTTALAAVTTFRRRAMPGPGRLSGAGAPGRVPAHVEAAELPPLTHWSLAAISSTTRGAD